MMRVALAGHGAAAIDAGADIKGRTMSFACPVSDQRLVLDHVVAHRRARQVEPLRRGTDDMVDAVLQGAAEFAEGEFAPLNAVRRPRRLALERWRGHHAARLCRTA